MLRVVAQRGEVTGRPGLGKLERVIDGSLKQFLIAVFGGRQVAAPDFKMRHGMFRLRSALRQSWPGGAPRTGIERVVLF